MVALVSRDEAERIATAINYDGQIKNLETDKGAWLKAVRGFAKIELNRLGIRQPDTQNRLCNTVEGRYADEIVTNYTGFKNYFYRLHETIDQHNAEKRDDSGWQPYDTTKTHVVHCYRIVRNKNNFYIYSDVSRGVNFLISDPAIIDQIETITPIKHLKHNQMVSADYEVYWRYFNVEGTTNHLQQVVEVKPSVLSDDEKEIIRLMVEHLGIGKSGDVPDNIADRAMLESLYMRGWITKTNQTNIPLAWTVSERTAKMAANNQDEKMNIWKERLIEAREKHGLKTPMPEGASDRVTLQAIFNIPPTMPPGAWLVKQSDVELETAWTAYWADYERKAADRKAMGALKEQSEAITAEAFPRDENNQPLPDGDETIPNRGKNDPKVGIKGATHGILNKMMDDRGVPNDDTVRHDLRVKYLDGSSKTWTKGDAAAIDAVREGLLNDYPTPKEQAIRSVREVRGFQWTHEACIADIRDALKGKTLDASIAELGYDETMQTIQEHCTYALQNAPQSNEKASNFVSSENQENTSDENATSKIERSNPSGNLNNQETVQNFMNEAAFVVLVSLFAPNGAEMKFTVRAMTADELADRLDALRETFITKRHYKAERTIPATSSTVASQSQAAQPATPMTPGVQTAQCVMIKAALSYEGQKPQLEFTCNGMDKPLKFTKAVDKQLGLLSGVRKLDGSAFTPNDLQPNMMYPGNWFIDWKYSEDGKFRNVVAIRPALAAAA